MARSILSVIAGYVVSAVIVLCSTLATVPLFTDVPLDNRRQAAASLGLSWYLFEFVFVIPAGLIGGYVTALIAKRSPLKHAAALAALILLMGVGSVIWSAGFKPMSHDVAVTLVGVASCLAGGAFRRRQISAKT